MKKTLKSIIALVLLLTIAIAFPAIVKAEDPIALKLSSSNTIKAGAEVKVTLSIASINISGGIDTITGTLEYNKDIFEEPKLKANPDSDWGKPTYNDANGMFAINGELVNTAGIVMTITFTVKSGITPTDTDIKLTNIEVSDGTTDISAPVAQVTIKKYEPPAPSNPPAQQNNVVENNTVVNDTVDNSAVENNVVENNVVDNNTINDIVNKTTTTGSLPKAGIQPYTALIYIVVLAIAGIFSYMKYKDISKIK